MNYDLKCRKIRKQKNLKLGWIHSLVSSLPSTNLITLAILVQKHAKVDMKLFLSCPILMDFSILFQLFSPGLPEQANIWL